MSELRNPIEWKGSSRLTKRSCKDLGLKSVPRKTAISKRGTNSCGLGAMESAKQNQDIGWAEELKDPGLSAQFTSPELTSTAVSEIRGHRKSNPAFEACGICLEC